jgi:RNase H-fold protein (predicted Holliday junction resolvase)
MSLKRYRTVIKISGESEAETKKMVEKAEKILKEEKLIFLKLGYEFSFSDTRNIKESKIQKYVKKIFKREGVNFVFWASNIKEAPQNDEELVEYLEDFLIEKKAVTVSEVREEIHVGKGRAIRLMNELVECGLSLPRKDEKGSKWKVNKDYEGFWNL